VVTIPSADRPPDPVGLRERKKRQTRSALIGSALRLVADRGLAQVTVEEISADADVSLRTFFNYFRSKEDAVTGGGVIAGERLTRLLRDAPPEVPVPVAIRRGMLAEAEAIERDPTELLLVLTIVERTPALKPHLVAAEDPILHSLAVAVGDRLGLDPAAHGYPRLIAAVSIAAFRQTVFHWHDGGCAHPLTELLDAALGELAAGLREPAHSGPA
jgi:AcrR family transcriptional regulator